MTETSRHLPPLLCHLLNIDKLSLTLGEEVISQEIFEALSKGPSIRSLVLQGSQPEQMFLLGNPWPQIVSLTIRHSGSMQPVINDKDLLPPAVSVQEFAVYCVECDRYSELDWWLRNSKGITTHLSVINGVSLRSLQRVIDSSTTSIRSLTVGTIQWDRGTITAIHSLPHLQELRLVGCITLVSEFPSHLPDTIEHLLFTVPYNPGIYGEDKIPLGMDRPALLKTCMIVSLEMKLKKYQAICLEIPWAEEYNRECLKSGVSSTFIVSEEGSSKWLIQNPYLLI